MDSEGSPTAPPLVAPVLSGKRDLLHHVTYVVIGPTYVSGSVELDRERTDVGHPSRDLDGQEPPLQENPAAGPQFRLER